VKRSRLLPSLAALLVVVLLAPAPVAAAGEPAGYEYFHTYAEVKAEIDDAVAVHPDIAARFSMGVSYEGRQIWGIKISDNVAVDEDEPEIFINAQIHARERMSNELAMYLIDQLTSGYGVDQRITNIVDSREIWIVPMVNPDGAEYDMSDGVFRHWRKNRQPIPGSTAIGVDLNRQFGFKWNCCGGGGNNPFADKYRGTEPWLAPETRAYRDFVLSRVVNGRQQLRVILSLHAHGRLVMWPFNYTKKNVPRTMRYDDWRAFVALGHKLAAQNGYRPEQGSDLYIIDGDQDDWAYGTQRIFAFAFELAAGKPEPGYPTLAQVHADEQRNRPAVLLLLEQADCPYRAAGAALAAKHCPAS
jgi:carboxypeptidase T